MTGGSLTTCSSDKSFSHTTLKYVFLYVFLLCVLPGDRYFYINDVNTQVEFKSHQWFGATVRSHGDSVLVRMGPGLVGLSARIIYLHHAVRLHVAQTICSSNLFSAHHQTIDFYCFACIVLLRL